MLKGDRVICDLCRGDIGQLHNLPSDFVDSAPDMRVPPHYAVCPVCFEYSVPLEPEQDTQPL